MSELALRTVANEVAKNLEQRGFSIPTKPKFSTKPSGTSGHWCKCFDLEDGHLDIWFDKWRHTERAEFYYGFFSPNKKSLDRYFSLFEDGSIVRMIRSDDEEYFEGGQVRLKKRSLMN